MMNVNHSLQREILAKESEMASMSCDREVAKACEDLGKKIDEQTQLIYEYQHSIYCLNSENEELSEKLCKANGTISKYIREISELEDTVHSLEDELERQSMKSSALASHVEGLNSFIVNSRRLDESLEDVNYFTEKNFHNNNNNNHSLENSILTITVDDTSPDTPIMKRRSFSVDVHSPIPILRQRNHNYYRSTTYKESERYLSIADEMRVSGAVENDLKKDQAENEHEDTQLSIFFDSLHEGRRESVPLIKATKGSKVFLERVKEDDSDPEVSRAWNELLSQLQKENENLRKANETLALAQLASKRPKRGFKICVIS